MNTNESPEEIYDLLEQFSFEQLGQQQQKMVLQSLDKQTYDEMHDAFKALKGANHPEGVRGKAQIKREIFDQVENQRLGIVLPAYFKRSVSIGKAAILVLSLLSALLWSLLREPSRQLAQPINQPPDTVFLTQHKIVPEIVRDTIYTHINQSKSSTPDRPNHISRKSLQGQDQHRAPGVHIVSASELDATTNQSKNNSLKHDSLARQFKFVSL